MTAILFAEHILMTRESGGHRGSIPNALGRNHQTFDCAPSTLQPDTFGITGPAAPAFNWYTYQFVEA